MARLVIVCSISTSKCISATCVIAVGEPWHGRVPSKNIFTPVIPLLWQLVFLELTELP